MTVFLSQLGVARSYTPVVNNTFLNNNTAVNSHKIPVKQQSLSFGIALPIIPAIRIAGAYAFKKIGNSEIFQKTVGKKVITPIINKGSNTKPGRFFIKKKKVLDTRVSKVKTRALGTKPGQFYTSVQTKTNEFAEKHKITTWVLRRLNEKYGRRVIKNPVNEIKNIAKNTTNEVLGNKCGVNIKWGILNNNKLKK